MDHFENLEQLQPADSQVAAFFDLDHTVLNGSSGLLFVWDQWRKRQMSFHHIVAILREGFLYKLGRADFTTSSRMIIRAVAGRSEEELWRQSGIWFQDLVAPRISAEARRRVQSHLARRHRVALLSASTIFATTPAAISLGLRASDAIATQLQVEEGRLTGEIIEPMCYGAGKVFWATRWAEQRNVDLARSFFYTDSISDLPMLERVGRPVAVNPDPRLKRHALQASWPIVKF